MILFTVHYEPSRYVVDPGSLGGGDEIEYYPVTDTQGTVYKLLNSSGTEVAGYSYSPFGERLTNISLTSPPSSVLPYMPLGYGGTYSDPEIELLYAKSRYFDPYTTRFTSKDSYRGSKTSVISQNRYIYCHQNPVKYADPAGYAPVEGDHAEPCTQTDQDMHYEPGDEELLPPELNNPGNILDGEGIGNPGPGGSHSGWHRSEDGTTWIPDGYDENSDGSFTIRIGKQNIKVTVSENGDGDLRFSFKGNSSSLSKGIAQGLKDAFRENPGLHGILAKPGGVKLFEITMNSFFDKHFDEWNKNYGDGQHNKFSYSRFAFCAALGYSIAMDLDPYGADVVSETAINLGFGSKLELLMSVGFWTTHFNSKQYLHYNFLKKVAYSTGNSYDLVKSMGLLEIAREHAFLLVVLTNKGLGYGQFIGKSKSSIETAIGALSGLAATALGLAVGANPMVAFAVGVASFIYSVTRSQVRANVWENKALVTTDMHSSLIRNGLNAGTNISTPFMTVGSSSQALALTYTNYLDRGAGTILYIDFARAVEEYIDWAYSLEIGDPYYDATAEDEFMDAYIKGRTSGKHNGSTYKDIRDAWQKKIMGP